MKKWMIIILSACLLTGCSAVETFETLGQVEHESPVRADAAGILLSVPEEASLQVTGDDSGITMYECEGYTIYLQTFASGDLQGTIQTLSGFAPEQLMIMESTCQDHKRYDWVWTAVADEGDLVCRGAVLDDGGYHYSLCVVSKADHAGELTGQWNDLFSSFCLEK